MYALRTFKSTYVHAVVCKLLYPPTYAYIFIYLHAYKKYGRVCIYSWTHAGILLMTGLSIFKKNSLWGLEKQEMMEKREKQRQRKQKTLSAGKERKTESGGDGEEDDKDEPTMKCDHPVHNSPTSASFASLSVSVASGKDDGEERGKEIRMSEDRDRLLGGLFRFKVVARKVAMLSLVSGHFQQEGKKRTKRFDAASEANKDLFRMKHRYDINIVTDGMPAYASTYYI